MAKENRMSALPLKNTLEDLLRSRRLHPESASAAGDRRLLPLATGAPSVDALAGGGFPRGEISQLHGPRSSGRTALALGAVARATRDGMLSAWIDAADQLDPASAGAAGALLSRLLWIRGRTGALKRCFAAASTVLGSGLFDLVVLDLADTPERDRAALPGSTWVRMHRFTSGSPTALLIVTETPLARSPAGVSLALQARPAAWSGTIPGRLLRTVTASATRDYRPGAAVSFERRAVD
jgi:hypothetical protein